MLTCGPVQALDTMPYNLARVGGPTLFAGVDAGTPTSGFATAAMGSNIRFRRHILHSNLTTVRTCPCCCMSLLQLWIGAL